MQKNKLKILYIGGQFKGSTGLERRKALEELGHTVDVFDTDPYVRFRGRLQNALTHRLGWGPAVWQLNKDILKFAEVIDYELVWVSKGAWFYPKTIKKLKKEGVAKIIHYNTDDPFGLLGSKRWRTFIKAIPIYDIHYVRRQKNIDEYRKRGAVRVIRAYPNYSSYLHKPIEVDEIVRKQLGGPVGFIGDYEKERAEMLHFIASNGIPVRVWGPNWKERCSHKHPNLKIEGKGLYGEDYVRAINSFDINLCFLRKCNRDLSTSRSLEIPGCGAFMLAERTSEHLELFKEGKEAEFFEGKNELIKKIKYFLTCPEEREQIAKSGLERCQKSKYDNLSFMAWAVESSQAIKVNDFSNKIM